MTHVRETEKQFTIRFPPGLFAFIQEQAREQKRSFNAQVIWMLQEYVKQKGK